MSKKLNKNQKYLFDNIDKNNWREYINIDNLKIARENVGLSTREATKKICGNSLKDLVLMWEKEESYLTWKQLEKMGKEYNVNFWFFLQKETIKKEEDIPSFRSDNQNFDDSHLKKFIHYVRSRQSFLFEAIKNEGIGKNNLVGIGKKYNKDPIKMADFIREKIGYKVQLNKKDDYVFKVYSFFIRREWCFCF